MRTGRDNVLRISYFTAIALLFYTASPSNAQLTNESSVLNGIGNGIGITSTGGTLTNYASGAQPSGIAVSSSGGIVNYAGFLGKVSLKPELDTDGDGLSDEIDSDNDNDLLSDEVELAGSGFGPNSPTDLNVADTDGDGINDGEESVAGSNPTNDQEHLMITSITNVGGTVTVAWQARQDKVYQIRNRDDAHEYPTNILSTTTGNVGSAPWFVTTNTFAGDTTNLRTFAIEVQP